MNTGQIKIILKLKVPNLLNMFKTKYYIKYSREYTNSCYPFFFLHNFKLKPEVNIDLKPLPELSKFGFIGLLHFYKGILPSHMAEFSFNNLRIFRRTHFFCKKTDILILKVTIRICTAIFAQKLSTF